MASAVLGKRGAGALHDERIITKAAIDEILKYYHHKPVDIPAALETAEEQMEYALRPHGILYRGVKLSGAWYRDSFGPMIAFRAEDGLPVVLLPKKLGGYEWSDAEGNRVRAGKRTVAQLQTEALCFYAPLPLRSLAIPDLLGFMKGCLNSGDFAFLIFLTIAVTSAGMLTPRITKFLSGFVLESGNGFALWTTGAFLLCALIASQLFTAARELAMARLQGKVALPMEAAMFMRLMSLPAPFFRQFAAGDLAARSDGINRLTALLLGGVFSAGITAIASLLYINQIFSYTPALGFPALLTVLIMASVTVLTGLLRTKEARAYMRSAAEESGVSFAVISGIQKIKLSGAEKRAFARWARIYAKGAEVQYNPPLLLRIQSAVTLAVSAVGTVALYWYAAKSGVEPAAYLASMAAYGVVMGAFVAFADVAVSAAQIGPILEMAEPILRAAPETAEGKEIVTKLSGSIELSNVSFRYSETGPWIIDDLDLRIRAGEYVAIVGRTGCGKSTLMRLLLGFEKPEKGAIYYDRKDINTLDLSSLRRNMGVVTQDGSLFLGDIFSNITVSAPELTLDEAWDAAEKAGIADDIRAMPMGMSTFISEGQGGISGGQKQRLMIARAIAPKPKILLFDEATSALDNKTQKQVSDALAGLKCTRIVIAHRLSTVKPCDRILVLEGGRIVEQGTYDALLERDGVFARLVERQRLDL